MSNCIEAKIFHEENVKNRAEGLYHTVFSVQVYLS